MTTGVDWVGVTVAVRGLDAETSGLLRRQVARFQQARRQACLSRLMATDPRAEAIVRRLVPHPALWQEAERWATCLLAADPDLLGWYRQVLERTPGDDVWQQERTFYRLLRPVVNRDETLAPSSFWGLSATASPDLTPWLGARAKAVTLDLSADLLDRLASGRQPVLGQWLYWDGDWVVHLFLARSGADGRHGARVAAALLLPSLVAQGSTAYQVRKGDTLWGIAKQNLGQGQAWGVIHDLNRQQVADPRLIYPGQRLAMPAAGETVVVRAGDTLWSLTRARTGNGHQWSALWQANRDRLARPDRLPIGVRLRWPERWQLPMTAAAAPVRKPKDTKAGSRPPQPALASALQQRPVARQTRSEPAVSPPPIRFLMPGTMPTGDETPATGKPPSPATVQASPVPLPATGGMAGGREAPSPGPVVPEAEASSFPAPLAGGPPALVGLPAREGTPTLQPAQPLNRLAESGSDAGSRPLEISAPPERTAPPANSLEPLPAGGSDMVAVPAETPPDNQGHEPNPQPAVASDDLAEPVAAADGDEPDVSSPLPSLPPVSWAEESIRPATGGTDPWDHWLHPERPHRPPLENAATVLPLAASSTLWPRIGYQAVPEYLTETIAGGEALNGWAVNRQRLSAEWDWSGWQLKSRWTFGRYELPVSMGRVNRQESWVDLDLGQRWPAVPGLELGLAARGTWWQRRSAGVQGIGLAAADAQGFGLGPVGSLAWEVWPGQSLLVETAFQPLVPVSFSGAVAGSGQLGMVEGALGWQGRWGMWQPRAGYRARLTYDADGSFGQVAHGLVVGLSLGWQPAAANSVK